MCGASIAQANEWDVNCVRGMGDRIDGSSASYGIVSRRTSHNDPSAVLNVDLCHDCALGLPSDCAELKAQNTQTNSIDGNYTVLVAGFRVHVYCYRMNETLPKTYLNVPPSTNFAEFYPKRYRIWAIQLKVYRRFRLAQPYTCSSCEARACTDDGHVKQGRTRFRKLRIDLQNMKVNRKHF